MTDDFRERILRLPLALEPLFDTDQPNEPFSLFRGTFYLQRDDVSEEADGEISFHWLPYPNVRFSGKVEDLKKLDVGEVLIHVSVLSLKAKAILTSIELIDNGWVVSGSLNGGFRAGGDKPADVIDFELANFHPIIGEPVRISDGERLGARRSRLTFTGGGWDLVLDEVEKYNDRVKKVKAEGGYVVSTVGQLRKSDGSKITTAEADAILPGVHTFLSFARGRWCTPLFPRGRLKDQDVWKYLGSWKVSPWKDVNSWFPRQEALQVSQAWTGFLNRWFDPNWQDPISTAIHWYVEANSNAGAIEGSIVLAQTALELMSWVILVEDNAQFSATKFDKLRAAEKIGHLLDKQGIPLNVPSSLPALRQAANVFGSSKNGPEVFVSLRNGITHPKKSKREKERLIQTRARWETLQLGLWYLELILLRLFSYNGDYYTRLKSGFPNEVREAVPWRS